MFVEKLSIDEIKSLIKMTIRVSNPHENVADILAGCKIFRYSGGISVEFGTYFDHLHNNWIDEYLSIRDFEISSSIIVTGKDERKINLLLQKSMYKKFGCMYIDAIKSTYKKPLDLEYQRRIQELERKIEEIVK